MTMPRTRTHEHRRLRRLVRAVLALVRGKPPAPEPPPPEPDPAAEAIRRTNEAMVKRLMEGSAFL